MMFVKAASYLCWRPVASGRELLASDPLGCVVYRVSKEVSQV